MPQGPFSLYLNDTLGTDSNFSFLGGTSFTGVTPYDVSPDWTQVVNNFTVLPTNGNPGPALEFTCDWTVAGTTGTGTILKIVLQTTNNNNSVGIVLQDGVFALGSGNYHMFYPPGWPCFKEDTNILTNNGYVPIQNLRKGDLIKTARDGYKPVYMIGKRDIHHSISSERVKDKLYKCAKNKYDEVFEDLIITGAHSILVNDFTDDYHKQKTREILGDIYTTGGKYRLPACVDERASVYEPSGMYSIYHISLENDNYYSNYGIYANGLLVESCSKRYLKELAHMTIL